MEFVPEAEVQDPLSHLEALTLVLNLVPLVLMLNFSCCNLLCSPFCYEIKKSLKLAVKVHIL